MNNFDKNPITNILGKVSNEEAVKSSLKNIVKTMVGERFYDSNKGSKITQSLFEPYDLGGLETIKIQLKEACYYEPRAQIIDIRLNENLDSNAYDCTIVFSVINIPDQIYQISIPIQRVR